jgi:hypothetical protein
MRHRDACRLAARQPRRQDRALAHARTAGDHDPAVAIAVDQQLIEATQQLRPSDELLVALPLAAVVELLAGHPTEHHSRKRRSPLRSCARVVLQMLHARVPPAASPPHVVSASYDQMLKVWELATGHALATLKGHRDGHWSEQPSGRIFDGTIDELRVFVAVVPP